MTGRAIVSPLVYATLEIGIHRRNDQIYHAEVRFTHQRSSVESRHTAQVALDRDHLRQLADDPTTYGQTLGASLFADPTLRDMFVQARSIAFAQPGGALHLQLFVGDSAPELHSLRWETLRYPHDTTALLGHERFFFSRFIESQVWHTVQIPDRSALRTLAVLSSPSDIGDYAPDGEPLADLDMSASQASLRHSLHEVPVTVLASSEETPRPTMPQLMSHVRQGYHILYVLAHGAMVGGEPRVWLEDGEGRAEVVAGRELVTRIRSLHQPPLLVILASCQSSGTAASRHTSEAALAALGPQLAAAGIPAVLAMQGNITKQTTDEFLPVFFSELLHDGQIDRAMAVARSMVVHRHDWWMPVLFLSIQDGRLWQAAESMVPAATSAGDTGLPSPPPSPVETSPPVAPSALRDILTRSFHEEELKNLCFDLEIDYEVLPAAGKSGKVRELVSHAQRYGLLPRLTHASQQKNPHAFETETGPDQG